MAASVTLNVSLNKAAAEKGLSEISKSLKPLTTPIKLNIDTKGALASLKDLNTIASKLEATLQKGGASGLLADKIRNGYASKNNVFDEAIRQAETASKNYAAALKQQMQAEQEAVQSRRGLVSEMNAWDQAIHANEASGKAFSDALRQQMQAEQEAAREAKKAGQAAKESGDDASLGASGWSAFGGAVATAMGHLASRAIRWSLQKIKQGIQEALSEMKNVDTELTNISKVSGKTGAELADIGDRAYDTATKYGVAASEYLSAVYDMQKAGMGDQSEAMGELAIKTMLVGDTTQDVASKFLLSANAAWKFGGNMESLSKVVDEADYINNNYATTLDKLASGMPIVASVAAQAGMSAEETMAALGTITHVTQESGSKAATALRALILNISGQVGKFVTEEGEEFEVTEESVKSLQGLLEKYAKTEMDAAKAAGELVNPMTAIQALFKGMSESDLNEAELFNLLSSMGGKLRTNQLTALVQNYELFDEMLGKIGDSAGTADNEIELMMKSWEKRSQVLKNSWTELVANVLDTETVKGFVDSLAGTVQNLTDLLFPDEHPQKTLYDDLFAEYESLKGKSGDLNGIEQARLEYLEKQLDVMKQQADLESKQAAEKTQKKLTEGGYWSGYNESGDAVGFTGYTSRDQAALNDLRGQYKELSHLAEDFDIKAFQQSLRELVDTNEDYYQSLVEVEDAGVPLTQQQKEFKDLWENLDTASKANIKNFRDLGDGLRELYDDAGNLVAVVDTSELPEKFDMQDQMKDSGAALKELDSAIGTLAGKLAEASGLNGEVAEGAGTISYDGATASANGLLGVLKSIAGLTFPGMSGMGPVAVGSSGASGMEDAPGGPTLVNELGPELISDRGRAYIANGGKPAVINLHRGAIVIPAEQTKQALRGGMPRYARAGTWGFMGSSANTLALGQRSQAQYDVPDDVLGTSGITSSGLVYSPITKSPTTPKKPKKTGKGGSGSGGGGGGDATAKSVEDLAKETKDILSNIEKQAKLADNRKQYDKEVSLWEKGQKEIDKMVAQYKKAGYKETDDEVLDLLNKRYDYDKKREAASKKAIEEVASELKDKLSNLDKQAKLADTNGDYEKEVRFYEEAQEAIAEMVERYRKAGYADDSDEIIDLLQKNVDYGEKQVKIYKDRWNDLIDALDADTEAQEAANALTEKEQALADAREALANASKQRTVRTYNAATGQWEWVADQSKVKSAQDTLTKAEENYSKEVKDQAIKELERLRDTTADLNDVILGPALSAIMSQAESSDVFQNFARALNGVYGVGSFLASTEGSSKVLSTADSHDTIYTFGNVTLTEEQASSMSVAELASRLQVLKIS